LPYKIIDGKIEQLTYSVDDVMHKLSEDKIKFLDLQFTGLMGSLHHTTIAASMLRKENFEDGLPKLDGSSRGLNVNKRESTTI
jgi:glutamine synthetase